jgi:hypothetical protein
MRRKHHPRKDEVDSIAQRLRAERPEASPLELDRAKTTAMSRSGSLSRRGSRRRFAVAALTIGLMAAGTGGVIAGGTTSSNPTNAATAQYGLGQGGGVLGNKNHKPPMSHRYIRVHINVPHRVTLTKVTVLANGKVLFVLKNRNVSSTIVLGYLPCSRKATTITIIAVESNGAIIKETRLFHLCQAAVSSHKH